MQAFNNLPQKKLVAVRKHPTNRTPAVTANKAKTQLQQCLLAAEAEAENNNRKIPTPIDDDNNEKDHNFYFKKNNKQVLKKSIYQIELEKQIDRRMEESEMLMAVDPVKALDRKQMETIQAKQGVSRSEVR